MPHTSEQGGVGGGGSREARSLTPLPSAWTPEVSLPVRPGSSMATMAMAAEQLLELAKGCLVYVRPTPRALTQLHAPSNTPARFGSSLSHADLGRQPWLTSAAQTHLTRGPTRACSHGPASSPAAIAARAGERTVLPMRLPVATREVQWPHSELQRDPALAVSASTFDGRPLPGCGSHPQPGLSMRRPGQALPL